MIKSCKKCWAQFDGAKNRGYFMSVYVQSDSEHEEAEKMIDELENLCLKCRTELRKKIKSKFIFPKGKDPDYNKKKRSRMPISQDVFFFERHNLSGETKI